MHDATIDDTQNRKKEFLKRLRIYTQSQHTALEAHPLSVSLFNEDVNLDDYLRYLKAMYGVVAGFEEAYYPILKDWVPAIELRRKTPWLAQDLQLLKSDIPSSISAPAFLESSPNPAYLLGKMYVMEGSVLGGAVIYKHLQPKLGFSPEEGGRYFYGYGSQTAGMWRAFLEVLTTQALVENAESNILKGAAEQFVAIQTFFDTQLLVSR